MDVDTSSYRRPEPIPNALDVAGKLGTMQLQKGAIERQGIGIEADKLKLMNERLGILGKEYTTLLADPDVMNGTPEATQKVQAVGQRMVNLGAMPAPMFAEFAKSIPTDAKQIPQWLEQQMARVQTISEATQYHLGQPGSINNGQTTQPTLTSPKPGFGVRSVGQPIQNQIPVTQPVISPDTNQEVLQGPTPAVAASGATVAPPQVGNRLPVSPPPMAPANVNAGPAPVTNKDQNRVGAPSGPAVGQTPLFGEGLKRYDADTQVANEKLASIKPAIQAYRMMDSLRSGPGTAQWNTALAFLKANNIIPTDTKNDPTAIYQEVNKKLSQYVAGSGTRSDADQALREASNPSVKTQISPALIKLTRDSIALDRARALTPYAFEGNDYSKYINHRGTFGTKISEEALTLDLLKPKERADLIADMKKKQNTFEGKKFWNTLNLVDKHNLIDLGGQ